MTQFKQMDITVDFPIEYNRKTGKVRQPSAMKLVKHLLANDLLKDKHEFFVTDVNGAMTFWTVCKSFNYKWEVSCEFTEDETEDEVDYYNALYFDCRGGKITDYTWESYKVV